MSVLIINKHESIQQQSLLSVFGHVYFFIVDCSVLGLDIFTCRSQHRRIYESPEAEAFRRGVFFENKRKIDEHNALYEKGLVSYKLGLKPFADKELHEITKKGSGQLIGDFGVFGAFPTKAKQSLKFEATGDKLPDHVDWREKGIVSPVKAQYSCLACWAFAATDALESQYAMKYGKHVLLSQQQFVDCSRPEGNLGCQGGMVDWAYQYMMRTGGVMLDSDYPYNVEEGVCQFDEKKIVASISNYGEIKNGSEISLQEAVAKFGPISVSIDSSLFEWNYYTTGVFDSPYCSTDVDHAVLVVGYGTENGTDYWLVKNSYGNTYGDHGYIKMARNKNNLCAIANYANFPIIDDADVSRLLPQQ
ncbi:unnamed protein product [Nesidiocoris tenuis]|uniref:Peptidase C1A papain C-terminal domain-containing protein n=1 Tax=Nesidiocoris tenuis TaxID=355587 RepID=A0A6H5HVH2_9HEMI|nr:unnamed protein product [Nesidiocoris tenuis]